MQDEINKGIAEFMGCEFLPQYGENFLPSTDAVIMCPKNGLMPLYTESIDALIPAVLKLSKKVGHGFWLNISRHGVNDYHMAFFRHDEEDIDYVDSGNVTPQYVAACTMYKAIKELECSREKTDS